MQNSRFLIVMSILLFGLGAVSRIYENSATFIICGIALLIFGIFVLAGEELTTPMLMKPTFVVNDTEVVATDKDDNDDPQNADKDKQNE